MYLSVGAKGAYTAMHLSVGAKGAYTAMHLSVGAKGGLHSYAPISTG